MLMSKENWYDVINCNLNGVFNVTRAVIITLMKQKKGKIINISSVSGVTGLARQSNYSASKAGIIGFTKSLAREVAPYGITVNAVAPGFIETEMIAAIPEKIRQELIDTIPFKRLGKPEAVSKLVEYLASENADYITGQVLIIDGGLSV